MKSPCSTLGLAFLACAAVAVAGCDSETTATGIDPNETCERDPVYFTGPPSLPLEIGTLEVQGDEEVFVPYPLDENGIATVPWVTGLQGGNMFEPVVFAPMPPDNTVCQYLELENLPDPEYPDDMGEVLNFPGFKRPARLVDNMLGPFLNQVGWSSLDGVRLVFRVTIRGPSEAAQGEVRVLLFEAPDP